MSWVKHIDVATCRHYLADGARGPMLSRRGQAFFQRWWRQQDDAMKTNVKALVTAGQLEFVNGGWCMYDPRFP